MREVNPNETYLDTVNAYFDFQLALRDLRSTSHA